MLDFLIVEAWERPELSNPIRLSQEFLKADFRAGYWQTAANVVCSRQYDFHQTRFSWEFTKIRPSKHPEILD